MKFKENFVRKTVEKLIAGEDYRENVVEAINADFFDFAIDFFKKIVSAKMSDKSIDLRWYKSNFINSPNVSPDDALIYSGLNKKTVTNIHKSATKKIVLEAAIKNIDYLAGTLATLENDASENLGIEIKISYKNVSVSLSLSESLIVINALATKKIALRGEAYSSIGKNVEKPLMIALCDLCGVPRNHIDASVFQQNMELGFDREVDFKIFNSDKSKTYRCEVKLMGQGNPESADMVIARDSNIFVADTLSEQGKNQLKSFGIEFLELRNNKNSVEQFRQILKRLNVPCEKCQ